MLHTGRLPDGGLIYPAMPFRPTPRSRARTSDAIFAYLRSVPPVHQPNQPHELRFPYNNRQLILGWRTLYFQEGEYKPDPKQTAEWNRGAYLVRGPGPLRDVPLADQRPRRHQRSAGVPGRADPDAELVRAVAHLESARPGSANGASRISSICCATGISHRGAVYGPMAEVVYNSLQYLTDADMRAMAVYLKSLGQGIATAAANRRLRAP